jgi:hypothetical protein
MCDAKIDKLLLVASNDRKKTSAMKMGSVGHVVVRLASSRAVSICPQLHLDEIPCNYSSVNLFGFSLIAASITSPVHQQFGFLLWTRP